MTGQDRQNCLVLYVSILASFVAFLDGSVVNVALPTIAHDLGGGLLIQQWVVDAYLITLGSLMLLAGTLADLFGKKKIMYFGLWGFAITSLLCTFATTGILLVIFRALQGITGALLVPSSLSFIISQFSGPAQSKAIGTWTAWTGIAFVIGPLVGGFLVDQVSWRLIFAINVVPIAVTLWLLRKIDLSESRDKDIKLDYIGAILCSVGLGGTVYGLIEKTYLPVCLGIIVLIIFFFVERSSKKPMLSLKLFRVRNFLFGNLATFAIYAALGASIFLLSIFTQQVGKYTALESGLALLPVTIIMFLFSSYFGAWSGRSGPRFFMTFGPIIAAAGFLSMLVVDSSVNYWWAILPGVCIFGLGLSITVAPLTSAVLGSVERSQSGIGSAINNAVARIAGLVAVATLGIFVGTTVDLQGFKRGMIFMVILLVIGGLISLVGIRNDTNLAK